MNYFGYKVISSRIITEDVKEVTVTYIKTISYQTCGVTEENQEALHQDIS